jgi:hypothetical protein
MRLNRFAIPVAGLVLLGSALSARATLPPPTPEQAQAQAVKKAAADAQAAKDKAALLASMDGVSDRWRANARAKGLKINPPTPMASPGAAVTAPADQNSPTGQPDGKLTAAGAAAPKTSEKNGTAAPSKDVKPAPSPPASTFKTVKDTVK